MSWLAQPAVLAGIESLAAVLLLPALHSERWLPGRELWLVALLLLGASGFVARAWAAPAGERSPAWLAAMGALLLLAGLGLDGIRGQHGTARLAVGQTIGNFEETGPDGRSLGLRPFGFALGLERVTADGVRLVLPARGPVELTRARAVALGSFRLGAPRAGATGEAAGLRVAAADGVRTLVADVAPGQPGRAGDLVIALDQYFADFALDQNQQPFSRSPEPRNPAALLRVDRGGSSYRVFVLQGMPGVHRVEALGLAFSLLDVEPETAVVIRVHRQPFALVVLLGGLGLVVGAGLSAARYRGRARQPARFDGALLGGAGLLACLLLADGGSVLAWSFGVWVAAGRVALEGVGVLLGVSLLASLAGTLLLAAQAAGAGVDVRPAAQTALWLSVLAGAFGVVLGAVRLVQADLSGAAARPLFGIALALLLLALALREWRLPFIGPLPAEGLWPALTPATLLLALGLGCVATLTEGTYATPGTAAAAATALLALAACEATGLRGVRRLTFLVSLLLLFVRPS